MTVTTEKFVFDGDDNLIAVGRDAETDETARDLNYSQIDDDAAIGYGHWNGTKLMAGPKPIYTRLQQAAFDLISQLQMWEVELQRHSTAYRHIFIERGHDFLSAARRSAYLIMGNRQINAGWENLTVDQRVTWAETMATGSQMVSNPLEFLQQAGTIPSPPTGAACWVNPVDGTKGFLLAIYQVTGTIPNDLDWTTNEWIGELED